MHKDGITKSPDYVDKVRDFPKPTNVFQLRQLLGLINLQRKYIPHCSVIAKPLLELTGKPKHHHINWTKEQTDAFEKLKEITKEITLFPDSSQNFNKIEVFVDASEHGAGACLVQWHDGRYHTIGYASMTFSSTQSQYCTTE